MYLVALIRPPEDVERAAKTLADAAGLALAEARMRLVPEPPALLARLAPAQAADLVSKLREAKVAALALDERVPSDADRTVARSFALEPQAAIFRPRSGEPLRLAWAEIEIILRAASAVTSTTERTETSRQVSLGRAIVTSGLQLTKTVRTTTRSSEKDLEHVLFVYGKEGRCAVLRERTLDFSGLGPAMQPVRMANMAVLARTLRERAPGAFYDERLVRLGPRPLPFIAGGQVQISADNVSQTRTSTAGALDVLAEAMRQAVALGLLP